MGVELPFLPRLAGSSREKGSTLWVRPNRTLNLDGVQRYALTFNGYRFAEAEGFDLMEFANERRREFERRGRYRHQRGDCGGAGGSRSRAARGAAARDRKDFVSQPRPPEYWPVDALTLAENLLLAGQQNEHQSRQNDI